MNSDFLNEVLMYIEFNISDALLAEDSANFITTIYGKIFMGYDETKRHVGDIEATYIDIESAINNGCPLFQVFDQLTQELCDYYKALFLPTGAIYKYIVNNELDFDWPESFDNLLLINRVRIYPHFRGKQYGLAAILRTIQKFGPACQFAILEVKPLQFAPEAQDYPTMKLEQLAANEKQATMKLKDHYAKMGFESIPDSNLMLFNRLYKQPSLEEIGFIDE